MEPIAEANGIIRLTITDIKTEAAGVKTFTVQREDGQPLVYSAGQFITLVFYHHSKEERRSYSISSCPPTGGLCSFTVKRVDNGAYSRMLVDTARPGIVLLCAGIAGRFVLPDTAEPQQLCFFAAGIGITPVYSILQALLRHTAHSAVLIYSNHDLESTVFYKELNELEAGYSNRLRIVWLFATDYNLQQARLNKALVHKLLKELNIGPECMHYICGPEAYMRMVTLALEEAGVTAGQVLRAHFVTGLTGPPVALSLLPPDTLPHTVTLHRRLQTVKLHCKYPETLLQAALSQGIAIPYSCRTGLCGSCVVQVITGHIWMGANDVLTPADIASGLALSCTGYPIGGDATVVVK